MLKYYCTNVHRLRRTRQEKALPEKDCDPAQKSQRRYRERCCSLASSAAIICYLLWVFKVIPWMWAVAAAIVAIITILLIARKTC